MPTPEKDWFAQVDAKAGDDWFSQVDQKATGSPAPSSSNFRPVEDIFSAIKGVGNVVYGMGKLVTEGPVRAAQDAANQIAVDVGADQAMGRSTAGSIVRRGAEAISPVPIAPIAKVARGVGYATHLTDTPEKPSEVAESIGELSALGALGAAHGTVPDEGTTFGMKRPSVSGLLPKDTNPVNLMMRAVRPQSSRLRAPQAFDMALRDLKKVEMDRGTPAQDLQELIDDIRTAKKANREQYAQLKDPQDARGATVDTTPVAKAMVESVPVRTRLQDPRAFAKVIERAKVYEGSHPVDTVDTLLQETNAALDSYFHKFPQARASARTNPETAADVAEADALRTQLYGKLDEPGGGTAARELQRRYGSLSELERAAQRRIITSQTKAQDNYITAYGKVSEIGHVARGGIRLLTGDVIGAGLDLAKGIGTKKAADYIAAQQTPDALIRRALAVQKDLPQPIEMPQAPVIRGELPPGVTRLGPAPEPPEPPIAQRGQYGARWTPPQKQLTAPPPQRMLERGAIRLGPVPEPEPPPTPPVVEQPPAPPVEAVPAAASVEQPTTAPVPIQSDPRYVKGTVSRAKAVKKQPAPAVTKPVEPSAPVAKPEQAAAAIAKQVDRVIDVSGAKSAGDVRQRIIAGLEKELAGAQQDAGFAKAEVEKYGQGWRVLLDGEPVAAIDKRGDLTMVKGVSNYTQANMKKVVEGPDALKELLQKRLYQGANTPSEQKLQVGLGVSAAFGRANGAGQVVMRIPGDGVFTVERNPYAIGLLLDKIKKSSPQLWMDLVKKKR